MSLRGYPLIVQHAHDIPASNAEHAGRVEPDLLCHLFGRHDSIWVHKEEHLKHLRVVLECFRKFNLKLKPSKCSFFQTEIVYLTHHVSKEGIHLSGENVHAIMEFPMLETYTEVRHSAGCQVITDALSETLHVWPMHCMIC